MPPPAVFDILTLNVGPFQFNVMGLYVILLALAPFAIRLLLAGRWWLLLLMSVGAYAANEILQWRILPSNFANQFPFLSWQVLLVLGLTVGFMWDRVRDWLDSPAGRTSVMIAWLLFAGFLFFTWNNPAKLDDPWGVRIDVINTDTFWRLYDD